MSAVQQQHNRWMTSPLASELVMATGPYRSWLVSLRCLLMQPNGGLRSGSSFQQALSSDLISSSDGCSGSSGRSRFPQNGVRSCMIISEQDSVLVAAAMLLQCTSWCWQCCTYPWAPG